MRKSIIKSITMLALILVSVGVWAQDAPMTPYQGSTHSYKVAVENASNTLTWEICAGSTWTGTALASNATSGAILDLTGVAANPSVIGITYGTALAPGDYTIRFTEDDGTCKSYRTLTVTVGTNNYNLAVSNPTDDCADPSVNGTVTTSSNPGTTVRTFTVTNADSNVSPWSYTVNVGVADNPAGSNDASFTFTVDGVSHTSGDVITVNSGTTSSVAVTVDNAKVLLSAQDITVSVVSQVANLVESSTSDNSGASQIYKLPDTGDIQTN